ncbi:membrane protein [Kitasatospora sp. MMS16-BH015]|uniref:divisome protein SepX/GlpR n=1 Tax=Kitasatospora sp. MMS16-BH015 TaxID=2018025 RepID=UPI000CA21908|nr:gephyrin-like molybdotransferase receptor GlpR [Kitasatospora sp. MMS16-BH015]AUG79288.1 membrane protein [Kitasatospora sp. MMS16-BH015]
MSSSGLIYAVIVGAWAAYLVPMWLRRQDELNEARPTERFSTAIRLLAGRSAMERRVTRALGDETSDSGASSETPDGATSEASASPGTASEEAFPDRAEPVDPTAVTADGVPRHDGARRDDGAQRHADGAPRHEDVLHHDGAPHHADGESEAAAAATAHRERRARLLARRRRMVTTLFLAFAAGAVVAAVAGVAFLWVPACPAILLTLYIGHLRRLERQRYEVKLDRVRAAQAAERLRAREQARATAPTEGQEPAPRHDAVPPATPGRPHLRLAAEPEERAGASAAALVEATDHEEWVDGLRERGASGPDSWEPVPVPLPTYVTAPVAPRVTRGLDLNARDTWDSGRTTDPRPANTPLFDQYADPAAAHAETRPRAANE